MNATLTKIGKGLLIAVVVIVVLCAFGSSLFTIFIVPAKMNARRVQCEHTLSALGYACAMYEGDHNGSYPTNWGSITNYAESARLFRCVGVSASPGALESVDEWSDFILVPGLSSNDPFDTILAYEPLRNHHGEGGNVLLRNYEVYWRSAKEYRSLKTKTGNVLSDE
jgi:hypothetical protein